MIQYIADAFTDTHVMPDLIGHLSLDQKGYKKGISLGLRCL